MTEHNSLIEAFNLGKAEAESLTIGYKFIGAMPEAEKHYAIDTPEYDVFITAYINVLKGRTLLVSPETGLITGFHFISKGT